MKKLCMIICITELLLASDFIPIDKIEDIASRFVNQRYGAGYGLLSRVTYYGHDEQANAYGYTFTNQEKDVVTIILGARYTTSPIGEVYKGIPHCERFYNVALEKIRRNFQREPLFKKYYYFGAGEEYAGFDIDGKKVLINVLNLQIRKDEDLIKIKPDPVLEKITREKWIRYLNTEDFTARQSNYVDSVPFIDWVYGCSPTAASMLFWYWDYRGYGKLVDYFFTHWDAPENEWNDCANTNRELALAMYTDTLTGGTYISNIAPGMMTVANSYNGYSFSATTSPQGGYWNQWVFSYLKAEIDAQRPCHWNVLQYWYAPFNEYINHSVTGVGYEITATDTFVIVHNTWDNNEPLWALGTYYNGVYSYDYVVNLVPGGSNPNNIFLKYPKGGIMFKGLKYYIKWDWLGTNIDHVKIWYSTGRDGRSYDSTFWVPITNSTPNTGRYLWTVPNQDSSFRINIVGLNSSNVRLAADGGFSTTIPSTAEHSPGVNLTSHYDTDGSCVDVVSVGSYLYCADYSNGIVIIDASDSSILDMVGEVKNIGAIKGVYYCNSYLYAVDGVYDTLRIFSLTNPQNPVQIGKTGITAHPTAIFVSGNYAYLACGTSGMIIVDCTNPNQPQQSGIYDSPGQVYEIFVSDTIAYVADGSRGLRIVSVANPSSPYEINYYDPPLGTTQGIYKYNNYIYLADGSIGVRILHLTSPTAVESISVYNTPGVARSIRYYNNHLFVADGNQGLRIIDISTPQNPVEAGYLLSKAIATRLFVDGHKIYLADDSDGLYLITHTLFGVENEIVGDRSVSFTYPTITNMRQGLRINLQVIKPTSISVGIYDIQGRLVDIIYQGRIRSGNNVLEYKNDLGAGIYFLSIRSEENIIIKKILFIK